LQDFPLICWAARNLKLKNLEDTYLFGIQHLSVTTALMFKALIERGMPSKQIFLIGKCYSSNPLAIKILRDLGVNISNHSCSFNSHLPYDLQFADYVSQFFLPLFGRKSGKWIILDDGGELIKCASTYKSNSHVVAIEQTSAGYHRAKSLNLVFPVINVARAGIKLEYESQFIARMISRKTDEAITIHIPNPLFIKILVIGSGAIGKTIRKILSKKYSVDSFDSEESRSDFNKDQFDKRISGYDVIIGCTGNCSLPKEKHNLIKANALLISASSSDREFDSVEIRKKFPAYYQCHRTIKSDQFTLVNSGFPINFDETFLDSSEFQLTRALLLTAIEQAMGSFSLDQEQFLPLKNEHLILEKFTKRFPKLSLNLEKTAHEITF